MAPAQVGVLVRDDRLELLLGEGVEHALGQHDPRLPAGDAVRRGRGVLQDPHPLLVPRDDVDELAVVGTHPPQPGADVVPGVEQPHHDEGADQHRGHDQREVRHRVAAVQEQRERRRSRRERGQDAAYRHRLPRHQGSPRGTPKTLPAGHETRGDPREEHREPREDERDHGLNGDRRRPARTAAPSEPAVGVGFGVSGGGWSSAWRRWPARPRPAPRSRRAPP